MGQDLAKIEATYDAVAREYAEKFVDEHEHKPKDREMLQRFAQELKGKNPVWDFGCGPGNTTQYLKDLGLDISGLDLSEKILDQAHANHPGVRFEKGNMLKLDFKDNSLAGVAAFYAIVHFSEDQVRQAFREIQRVLRPGGLFLFTFHVGDQAMHVDEFLGRKVDIDFMFFPTALIIGCLRDSGFDKIEIIERAPYPDVEYQSRRAYVFASKPSSSADANQNHG